MTRGTRPRRWHFCAKVPPILAVLAALVLSACSPPASQSGFQFVSPGGTTDIYYEKGKRQDPVTISGEALFHKNKTISTDDFPGKVVVVNIWGSWCPPCREEAPELQKVYEKTKDQGVVVLGIAVREVSRKAPQDFMRNRGLTYPSIYDPSMRSLLPLEGYPTTTIPSTIVLDEQHRVAAIFLRAITAHDLLPLVKKLSSAKPASP